MGEIMKKPPATAKACRLKSAQALRLAMEDPETACFMRAVFPSPEQRPEVFSSSWCLKDGPKARWMVLVGEKMPLRFSGRESLANLVLIEIDDCSGDVLRREFQRSLLDEEVREKVRLWLRRRGYKGRRMRPRLRRILR